MTNLLLLENNLNLRQTLKKIFHKKVVGLHITESKSFTDAFNSVIEEQPDVILTNIYIAGQSALLFVNNIIKQYPSIQIIILSEYNLFEYQNFAENIKKGSVVFADELNIAQIISKINILNTLKYSKNSKEIKKNTEKRTGFQKRFLMPVKVATENRVSFAQYIHTYIHTKF